MQALGVKGSYSIVTSSTGYNTGKRVWKMEMKKRNAGGYKGLGVVTNPKCTSKGKGASGRYLHNTKEVGISYQYFGNGGSIKKYDGIDVTVKSGITTWEKEGEAVTVLLDCDNWKMTWWLGEKKLATIEIEKNKKYYPAFSENVGQATDYRLYVL